MRRSTITFQRLEEDYDIGAIRSVTIDHERRMLVLIHDEKPKPPQEGASIMNEFNFTTDRGEQTR